MKSKRAKSRSGRANVGPGKKTMDVYLPASLVDRIGQAARREGRSRSNFVALLLMEALSRHGEAVGPAASGAEEAAPFRGGSGEPTGEPTGGGQV